MLSANVTCSRSAFSRRIVKTVTKKTYSMDAAFALMPPPAFLHKTSQQGWIMKAVIGSEIQYLTPVHLWLRFLCCWVFTCCNFLSEIQSDFLKSPVKNFGFSAFAASLLSLTFCYLWFSFSQFLVSGMWRIVVPQHKLMKKLWHLNTPQPRSRYTVRLCVTVVQIPKKAPTQ